MSEPRDPAGVFRPVTVTGIERLEWAKGQGARAYCRRQDRAAPMDLTQGEALAWLLGWDEEAVKRARRRLDDHIRARQERSDG